MHAIINFLSGIRNATKDAFNVQLSGSNEEDILEQLQATFKKDDAGLGLLRVALESVLSSTQDSVALGGALANRLAKQASGQTKVIKTNTIIPISGDASLPVTIFDIQANIVIQSLQIVTGGATEPDLQIYRYNSSGALDAITIMGRKTDGTIESRDMCNFQNTVTPTQTTYTHGLFKIALLDATTKTYELTSRPEANLEFPYGFVVKAYNYDPAKTYNVGGQILYLTM